MGRTLPVRAALLLLAILLVSGCTLITGRPTIKYLKYSIEKGDTVYALAERFGSTPQEIIELNGIEDPRAIEIGTVVRIPFRGKGAVPKGSATTKNKADEGSIKIVRLTGGRGYIGELAWPVAGAKVSSKFGRRWLSFHEGIDLPAKKGTPIRAAHAGTVAYSGKGLRGYGNLIIVNGGEIITLYAHNSRNRVRQGARVKKGEHIGDVGDSGRASASHLHFEVRVKNEKGSLVAVDPLVFYP